MSITPLKNIGLAKRAVKGLLKIDIHRVDPNILQVLRSKVVFGSR